MNFQFDHADRSAVLGSLQEDLGSGDVTAQLLPEDKLVSATLICRDSAVICGIPWFDSVFSQVDDKVVVKWAVIEGESVAAGAQLAELCGNMRSIVTAERCALNWLQMLSGTATTVKSYADLLLGTGVKLLDTRKTIPGFRKAQKYAVTVGGGKNHRMGLYDAFLIKENHIACAGSISNVVDQAKALRSDLLIEVEVENMNELNEAIDAGVDVVMLDNFTIEDAIKAVELNNGRIKLEFSGNVVKSRLKEIAQTGVDYISCGALTKDVKSIDLSMRVTV
jgi:nicotinate-nucleotide pyrophosphorylase (carboxylating)